MKKVISFSLWGDIPRYTVGAIKNADLALRFYPDFDQDSFFGSKFLRDS